MAAVPAAAAPPVAQAAVTSEGELIKTIRGGHKLACDGFIYRHKHNNSNGIKGWQCDQADKHNCKGACKTKQDGDKVIVEVTTRHNHLPTPDVVTGLRLKAQMREQAVAQPTATVVNLAASSLQGVVKESLPFAPSNHSLKREAWKSRRVDAQKKMRAVGEGSPEPEYATLTELVLPDVKVHDEQFLLFDSGPGPKRIVLFGCQSVVDTLANSETWIADGTFKTSPKLFQQVYTIHAMRQGFCLPAIYALLPDKTMQTYNRLWTVVKDLTGWHEARELNLMVDFEKAAYAAFLQVFVGAKVSGCFFHFKQAIHRRIQELGLQTKYKDNLSFRIRVYSLGGLAFVQPEHVRGAFNELVGKFQDDETPLIQYQTLLKAR